MPEQPPTLIHLMPPHDDPRWVICGERTGWRTKRHGEVTCFACRQSQDFKHTQRQHSIVDDFLGVGTPTPIKLSGVMARSPEMVRLARLAEDKERAAALVRRHTPPYMNENDDGVFTFFDVHETDNWTLEVVPQEPSGNVEITLGDHLFTLSHLDRMDLVRALLHSFHYSPEVGGPRPDDV